MADKKLNDLAQIPSIGSLKNIYVEDANGNQYKVSKESLAEVLGGLLSYSVWTVGSKLKLTKGACCFILATYNSAYIVTSTGLKGAVVIQLGGNNKNEFREDASGNVYVLAAGMYFIPKIGYNPSNIIAEEISDYPSDCTTLVVQ